MLGVFLISNIVGCFPFDLNFSNIRNFRSPLIHPLLYPNIFFSFSYSAQTWKKQTKQFLILMKQSVSIIVKLCFFFAIEIREKNTLTRRKMKWGEKNSNCVFFKRRRKKNNQQSDPIFNFYFKWNDWNLNLLCSPGVDFKNVDSKCVQFHFFLQILTPRKKPKNETKKFL